MRGKTQKILYLAIIAIGIAFEVIYLVFGLKFATVQTVPHYLLTALLLLIASCIAIFIVDIFHELGHILTALCCGFQVQKISLSFLNFDWTSGKFKFYLSNPFGKLAGESVVLPKTDKSLKGKFIFITCGGLLFTFLFVFLGGMAFIFYKKLTFAVYLITIAAMPYAIYQFILNSLPLEIGGLYTDGKVVQDFLKNSDESAMLQTLLAIESGLVQGKTPKEISEKLYHNSIVLADDNLYSILYKLQKLYRYLDEENIDEALNTTLQLLQVEPYFPQEYREKILTEILFVLTLYTDDEIVNHLLNDLQGYLQSNNDLLSTRTKLVIYAKNEGFESIQNEWTLAYQQAATYTISGIARFECKLLKEIQKEFFSAYVI